MIAIVDAGTGNLASVLAAVRETGTDAALVTSPAAAAGARGLLLPGQGAFRPALDALDAAGFLPLLLQPPVPVLGICLGMQLLAAWSVEGTDRQHATGGLGHVHAGVEPLAPGADERLPHMGWNVVESTVPWCPFGAYYFCHSYALPASAPGTVATCDYAGGFAAAVQVGPIWGVQFHPEKSGPLGQRVLAAFVAQCRGEG